MSEPLLGGSPPQAGTSSNGAAAALRGAALGVSAGTLADRALDYLAAGPADSQAISRDVLGLAAVPPLIAERLVAAVLGADPRVGRLADGRWVRRPVGPWWEALDRSSFAVVDVETTGGSPARGHRIVEVAVVVVQGDRQELVFESLVNPGRPIPPFISALTGITDGMVQGQPSFGEIAESLRAVLEGRVFVAHNARFDWSFLAAEMARCTGRTLAGPRLCTLRLARRLVPELRSRGLDQLVAFFGIAVRGRHRAAPDALAAAAVLRRLLALARQSGALASSALERAGDVAPAGSPGLGASEASWDW